MAKRNSSSLKAGSTLSLATAQPLQPSQLSQSYTHQTDDDGLNTPSTKLHKKSTSTETSLSTIATNASKTSRESLIGTIDHIKVICRFRPINSKEKEKEKY